MSESIPIPDDRFTEAILRLTDSPPLVSCTTVGFDGGVRIVRADRPVASFSTGERYMWTLLESLIRGELRAVLNHADALTLAALSDMFARIAWAVAA